MLIVVCPKYSVGNESLTPFCMTLHRAGLRRRVIYTFVMVPTFVDYSELEAHLTLTAYLRPYFEKFLG